MKPETQRHKKLGRNDRKKRDLLDLQGGIVYGPINSRRLGRSLGINLLSTSCKICSMNCCYCQYGWTDKLTNSGFTYASSFPTQQAVTRALKAALDSEPQFDFITFSGNGEPTLHPEFPAIVDAVIDMKAFFRCDARLALLSNSTTCSDPGILAALKKIDLPIMKLDAGNQRAYERINRGKAPITFDSIVSGLQRLESYYLQTLFVQGPVDNSSDVEVASWIETLLKLAPLAVQIYSLDRGSANSHLQAVARPRLEQIADLAASVTSLKIEVY